ncbi:hypothetical protein PanWU01x14_120170 [Parasponia andersonii]|uniref:Uncharacterized protein n=1 Tax=Parasponia andersonii TaxID=3476 RepID=A0A2P5CUW3_PARAD|nr:hypothetical protein PanWU01x14_120170 [Parasponia andersonii]
MELDRMMLMEVELAIRLCCWAVELDLPNSKCHKHKHNECIKCLFTVEAVDLSNHLHLFFEGSSQIRPLTHLIFPQRFPILDV